MKAQKQRIAIITAALFLVIAVLACDLGQSIAPSKPVVGIGSPPHGAQVFLGQEVLVQAIAVDTIGITRIELWVDGMLITMAQPPSPQASYSAVLRWIPTTLGAHTLTVKAINTNSVASDPAAVALTVVGLSTPTLTPTVVPSPTYTLTSTPIFTATPTNTVSAPAACVNDSVFVEHVTVPDGTNWAAGQIFNKIWRVRNSGTCTWGPGYEFVFVGGEAMTTTTTIVVPNTAPGVTADLLVAMTAPTAPGTHSGQWRLRSPSTGLFGATLSVTINVLGAAAPPPGCPGAPLIASFDANPTTIAPGQKSTLSWGLVSNATSAVIDQGIGGVPTPGQMDVYPKTTTTYTLTATGCGGTVTKQVTITVTGQAIPTTQPITLQPITIPSADLEVMDIFVGTPNNNHVYVQIRNNGPDPVANLSITYSCSWTRTAYGATIGVNESAAPQVGTMVAPIPKGSWGIHNMLIPVDLSQYWYKMTCSIQVPFANLNTDKSNDSMTKTLSK